MKFPNFQTRIWLYRMAVAYMAGIATCILLALLTI
jgi:hypothetical protein